MTEVWLAKFRFDIIRLANVTEENHFFFWGGGSRINLTFPSVLAK